MNYLETIFEGIIGLTAISAVVLTIYFIVKSVHSEKMALIDKGLYSKGPKQNKSIQERYGLIKWGMLLISIGLGLFLGYIVSTFTNMLPVVSYFVMILILGGLGLIFSYIVVIKLKAREKNG